MSASQTLPVQAIRKIEKAGGFKGEEIIEAIECVMRDPDLANAYLALSSPELGVALLRRQITKSRKGALPTLQALAIAKIEKDESFTRAEVVDVAECILKDSDLANMYLAVSNSEIGAAIIRRELTKFRSRAQ